MDMYVFICVDRFIINTDILNQKDKIIIILSG